MSDGQDKGGLDRQDKLVWIRVCPVCGNKLEKENPASTVICDCGKFIWR